MVGITKVSDVVLWCRILLKLEIGCKPEKNWASSSCHHPMRIHGDKLCAHCSVNIYYDNHKFHSTEQGQSIYNCYKLGECMSKFRGRTPELHSWLSLGGISWIDLHHMHG